VTSRLPGRQEPVFRGKSALKEAIVDPGGELPDAYPPPDALFNTKQRLCRVSTRFLSPEIAAHP
jgi:hypothetical protein